jgi:hypothetical protein
MSINPAVTKQSTVTRQALTVNGLQNMTLCSLDSLCGRLEFSTSTLTLSQLMSYICGVSKTFGEWYQKTNKSEDTNKLTLLAFKIIGILHNTRLATFIKLLETVSKGLFRNRPQNSYQTLDYRRTAAIQRLIALLPLLTVSRSFINVANRVL